MSTTHGWTTLDASSITVWEHLPSGLRCQLVLQDQAGKTLTPTEWQPLEETLPDDAGRSIAHLRVMAGTAEVEIECGGSGDLGACRIANILGDDISAHWEVEGALEGWQVRRRDTDIIFAPENTALPEDVGVFLSEEWENARRSAPHGQWLLAGPLAAMEATVAANTFLLPNTQEVVTMSRHEVQQSGTWRLQNWQTFLTALAIAYIDPQLAVANCKTALRHLAVDSIFSAESTADGPRRDLSNPPVAAYCIWKLFQMTGDETLLNDAYLPLLRWHDWWPNARDGNQNDLLNWASAEETGMPGHPLYETAPTDPSTGVMRVDDVALCSLWALDCIALMRMALQVNDLDQATRLETELNEISSRMNLQLWDPVQSIFRSRDWDGFPTDRQSATVFLSLVGGVPSRGHESRLVLHLQEEYGTLFLAPTLGKDDPDFEDQLPWRGRVSPLLNFLICEGLRQFGHDELAEEITLSSLELLNRGWNRDHRVYSSYNAITGLGDDIPQDPLAPAGLLLGALGVGMLVDAEPWNGLRMGNLRGVDMAISGFPLHGEHYDISSGPWGLSVSRNGKPWFDFDRPAIIRNLSQTEREVSCGIKLPGGGNIRLRFHGFQPGQQVSVKVNGKATPSVANTAGMVDCVVQVDAPHGGHGIWHRAA